MGAAQLGVAGIFGMIEHVAVAELDAQQQLYVFIGERIGLARTRRSLVNRQHTPKLQKNHDAVNFFGFGAVIKVQSTTAFHCKEM